MSDLTREQIYAALARLGELADEQGIRVRLLALGGAVMALKYKLRETTRDVDAVILQPDNRQLVRRLAVLVSDECGLPTDWLNEAAKGYVYGTPQLEVLISLPGIEVLTPSADQLLAMKLSAWRDELDIGDASSLLSVLEGTQSEVWARVEPYLVPGNELKARYAFNDLWEGRVDPL